MPNFTNMKSEKEKLAAKSVNALKAAAKRIGANVVDPKTGKAKTKQQLINGILIKQRLSGKSMGGNAKPAASNAKTTANQKNLAADIKVFEQGMARLKKNLGL